MEKPARSFRLVCEPAQFGDVESLLEAEGFRFEPEPFSPFCRRLLFEPAPLGSSLAAFFGYIYIQDRSSMLPPLALAPPEIASVLDLAASPGSKSGFLAQLVGKNGFVLANEPNPARLATLRANLLASNLLQAGTSSYAGEEFPESSWKYILLDPPCSGWGTALKHPQAPRLWQGKKIDRLTGLQKRLLTRAASLLAPGGRLLYSTCTTNPAENQEQTRFAINELGLESVPLEPFAGFVFEDSPCGSLLVDGKASASQGFYLSLLVKPGGPPKLESERETEGENTDESAGGIARERLASSVCDPARLPCGEITEIGGKVRFQPRFLPGVKWQGSLLGKFSGEAFSPQPRLRALVPEPGPGAPALIMENVAEIRKLFAGASISCGIDAPQAGLWLGNLPLGICRIKNRRALASFK